MEEAEWDSNKALGAWEKDEAWATEEQNKGEPTGSAQAGHSDDSSVSIELRELQRR